LPKLEKIPNLHLIGLGHKSRHGKDTSADYIIRSTKGAGQKFSFADDLYAIARVVFGMTKKNGPMLQWLGTEGFRSKDPDTWVKSLYWNLYNKRPAIAVIPDCRFPNEADFIKQMGGTLIKVERLNADGSSFTTTDRDPNHPSEVALDDYKDWDYHVKVPEGKLDYLHRSIDDILWDLRDKIGADF
jgi:hypothetical protein